MYGNEKHQRAILESIAHKAMLERGLLPDFSAGALAQLDMIQAPAGRNNGLVRDQREMLWASIETMTHWTWIS